MFLTALAILLLCCTPAYCQDWITGRATFYGNEPWLWTIHYGSCGYGYLCPEEGTGWDVTALADYHPEYSGSCGRCYEVQCNPSYFTDGYGQTLNRAGVCRDSSASVVVTVTDTCPCIYATNAYSNRRWCCGDMNHFDLSVWAFEKLAEQKWGVIGLRYRQVPCDHQPEKVARIPPEGPFLGEAPEAYGESCPKNQFPVYTNRQIPQQAPLQIPRYSIRLGEAGMTIFIEPKETPQTPVSYEENTESESAFTVSSQNVDLTSNDGGRVCGKVNPGGVISLSGSPGSFKDDMMIEVWTEANKELANTAISIQGGLYSCQPLNFQKLDANRALDGRSRYSLPLGQAMGRSYSVADQSIFVGCNDMDVSMVDSVSFRNFESYEQSFCFDQGN